MGSQAWSRQASIQNRHRLVWSTMTVLRQTRISCACAWRRWRSCSARPLSCRTTSTLSGTISASIRRRRPPSESATTGDRSRCRCSHAPRRTLVRHLTSYGACGARCEVLTRTDEGATLRQPVRPEGSDDILHRTPRVHHAARRRGDVADGGEGAAASAERSRMAGSKFRGRGIRLVNCRHSERVCVRLALLKGATTC